MSITSVLPVYLPLFMSPSILNFCVLGNNIGVLGDILSVATGLHPVASLQYFDLEVVVKDRGPALLDANLRGYSPCPR